MTTKTFKRGEKRANAVAIVRQMKLTTKSSTEKRGEAADRVAKVNGFEHAHALNYVNWIIRNGQVVKKIKTAKAA